MSVRLTLPRSVALAQAQRYVSTLTATLDGFGSRWAGRLDFPTTYRTAPRTLTPRKGAPPRQETIAEVIQHFARDRDIFAVTDGNLQSFGQAILERWAASAAAGTAAVPNVGTLMLQITAEWKRLVIQRWETGGGDLTLKPLSPDYVAYKRRLGYPSRIGTLTGQSLDALRKVRAVAVRIG